MIATIKDAYSLLHDGSIALAHIESNGIRIDQAYLQKTVKKTVNRIKELQEELRNNKVFSLWRKEYGEKTKLGSREQLARILFDKLKLPYKHDFTKTGRYKADLHVFESLSEPFVKDYIRWQKLIKLRSTYLAGIEREIVDGFIHPVFNLHTVLSYRSSSDSPNFQNYPIRDPLIGKLIRRCFIPRDGHVLIEADLRGAEVGCSACYNLDPVLISYIKDTTKDMHRDMAIECYKLSKLKIDKDWWKQKGSGGGHDVRYCAKNMYVFPEFYGSYYLDCSKGLWDAIDRMKLCTPDGKTMKEHLRDNNITKLGACNPNERPVPGTLEFHIKEVEHGFWKKRFKVYDQWRTDWYEAYRRNGYFDMLTGFRVYGLYRRNEVWNLPVQGSAFHWLLWGLIRLQNWLMKYDMKTKIVGQIHDSMLLDVPKDEINDVCLQIKKIMEVQLPKAWPWIIVPIETELEIAEDNWHMKHKFEIAA